MWLESASGLVEFPSRNVVMRTMTMSAGGLFFKALGHQLLLHHDAADTTCSLACCAMHTESRAAAAAAVSAPRCINAAAASYHLRVSALRCLQKGQHSPSATEQSRTAQ